MTAAIVLIGCFFILVMLNVPIAISIGFSVLVYLFIGIGTLPVYFLATNMFTSCDSFPLMAIPFFVLAGGLMEKGGLSKRLVDFCETFVGHITGGLAMVTVLACMFFGAISGSAPATVAAIGAIMLPEMIKKGYDAVFSVALIATAGILGIIIPPSIPMVMYGVASGESVGTMFMAGFIPGLLLTTLLMAFSYFYCKKHGYEGNGLKFSFPRVWRGFKNAILALLNPVIILGGIYGGIFTPTEAATVAVIYAFVVGKFAYKELSLPSIFKSLTNTAVTTGTILIIVGTTNTLGKIFTLEQIPRMIADGILGISDSPILILLVLNLFLLLVGMLMETTSAILLLTPILLPIVISIGMNPVHFGLMMIVNLGIGFITPPVGVNLFVACSMGNVSFEHVAIKVIPMILVMLVGLLIVAFVPALTLFIPHVLTGY